MRGLFLSAILVLSYVCAHGQTVRQEAAGKTLARKAEAACNAETPRVTRMLTAVVRQTRVYSVFYSPKFSKCIAAVYLPVNKTFTIAALLHLDSDPGIQHLVWEDVFPRPIDAMSALDVQIARISK